MLEKVIALDQRIFVELNTGISNWFFDLVMPILTDLFQFFWVKWVIVPALLILACIFKRWVGVFYIVLLTMFLLLTDWVSASVIKSIIQRPRPPFAGIDFILRTHEHYGYSFPSNHAANMYCFATISAYFFPRGTKFFFLLAFLVAFSRVYVGVHYPFDVLGGALLGILMGKCGLKIYQKIRKEEPIWRKS